MSCRTCLSSLTDFLPRTAITAGTRAIKQFLRILGGNKQIPEVEETTESTPDEDDINVVATLLEESDQFAPNPYTQVAEKLQTLLVGGDPTSDVQDLVDGIQHVRYR